MSGILNTCCCLVAKSCLTLCDLMDCSTPGLQSLTVSRSLPKFMSIESVILSNHLIKHLTVFIHGTTKAILTRSFALRCGAANSTIIEGFCIDYFRSLFFRYMGMDENNIEHSHFSSS